MEGVKPCVRCNGSGTEPDPVTEAARELAAAIGTVPVSDHTTDALAAAAVKLRDVARTRIDEREALLDEILGRFDMAPAPATRHDDHGPTSWIVQVPVADIQSWRERRQA